MTKPHSTGPAGAALHLGAVVTTGAIALGLALVVLGIPEARWVLTSGLMVLVALPVLRLIGVLHGFVRTREWRFVWAGIGVLLLLSVTVLWRTD